MADLSTLEAAQTIKIVGSDSAGTETNAVNSTTGGALQVNLQDSVGNELLGVQTSANSIPVVLASDQIVTNDFIPELKNNDRLKVETLNLGGPIVQVSSADQSTGYLAAKISGAAGEVTTAIESPGGAEKVQIGLANAGTAGTYGSATQVPVLTTDAKGRVASVTPTTIQIAQTQVNNLVSDLAGKQPLDADLTAFAALSTTGITTRTAANTFTTRTITGTAGNITVTNGDGVAGNPNINLPNVGTAGTFGDINNYPIITTDAQGRITSVTTQPTIPTYYSAQGQTLLQTTSTSYTQMTGLIVTPVAGTYLLTSGANTSATSNNRTISVAIEIGGVLQTNTETVFFMRSAAGLLSASSDVGCHSIGSLITVNGTQTVEVVWRTSGGTAQVGHRFLHLLKVG